MAPRRDDRDHRGGHPSDLRRTDSRLSGRDVLLGLVATARARLLRPSRRDRATNSAGGGGSVAARAQCIAARCSTRRDRLGLDCRDGNHCHSSSVGRHGCRVGLRDRHQCAPPCRGRIDSRDAGRTAARRNGGRIVQRAARARVGRVVCGIARLVGAHWCGAWRRILLEIHIDLPSGGRRDRDRHARIAARTTARAGTVRRLWGRDARLCAGVNLERASRLDLVRFPGEARPRKARRLGPSCRVASRRRFLRRPGRSRVADPVHHARYRDVPCASQT